MARKRILFRDLKFSKQNSVVRDSGGPTESAVNSRTKLKPRYVSHQTGYDTSLWVLLGVLGSLGRGGREKENCFGSGCTSGRLLHEEGLE